MQSYWQKLPRRTKIIVTVPLGLLASCCICFGGLSAYGSTLPTRTPTMTATETLTPTVTSTATQTRTPTITPTATETAISSDTPLPTETFTPSPTDTPTPAPTNTQAPATITLVSLTSPIKRGNTATLVIKTEPGATCFLSYTTPSGTASNASGLGSKTADANGQCKWSWTIGGSTNGGTGYVSVSVNGVSQSYPIVITE